MYVAMQLLNAKSRSFPWCKQTRASLYASQFLKSHNGVILGRHTSRDCVWPIIWLEISIQPAVASKC